jgi:SAM-dependent methyltransferase
MGAKAAIGFSTGPRLSDQPPLLFQMASAYWVSQAIYVTAKLAIADVLDGSPKTGREIADAVDTDEESLLRLMGVLCMLGICQLTESQKFELMTLGSGLKSRGPGSLRSMILTLGEVHYKAWGHLCESVQTGRPGFRAAFGSEMFEFLEKNSDAGDTFNLAMTDFSAFVAEAVLFSYDFSGTKSIIDVGGGYGKLLTSILEVYPDSRGVLVDLPAVISTATQRIASHPCHDRCAAIAENFLNSLPRNADLYLLSGVIHDWGNQAAERILKNCRNAMRPDGKVLVVECVVPDGHEPSFSRLLDLNMMVMTGGRERTEFEFRELFDAAGLRLNKVIPTVSPLSILEGVRK